MRLLSTTTLSLKQFTGRSIPPYVILSHTWDEEEVLFDDIQKGTAVDKKGFAKLLGCCRKAAEDGFEWAWIDTCCIDKSSSAELSEAINSMCEWYRKSVICYAYLQDVTANPLGNLNVSSTKLNTLYDKLKNSATGIYGAAAKLEREMAEWSFRVSAPIVFAAQAFFKSRWFTRGWTLQELIAPKVVEFYTSEWIEIGTKTSLLSQLSAATGIPSRILRGESPSTCSVAERISWASTRQTTREEDLAYCLLGLLGVNMPLLYGEGQKSFLRLQEQILKQEEDYSIFAWSLQYDSAKSLTGFLASSPSEFSKDVPSGLRLPTLQEKIRDDDTSKLSYVYRKTDTFANQIRTSDIDFYMNGSWYEVLYKKNYNLLRTCDPHRDSLPEMPQPPELTSRGLRISLPLRKPEDPTLPSVAWIYCYIENRLLCVLLERPTSSRTWGRHSAPWLLSVDNAMLNEFVVTEVFLHPNGLFEGSSIASLTNPSEIPWGRIKVKIPDTGTNITYVISAHPIQLWSLDEIFFQGKPNIIGGLLFESTYEQGFIHFQVFLGVYDGSPWCEIREAQRTDPGNEQETLSAIFTEMASKPQLFAHKLDRSAVFPAEPQGMVLSASIRNSPTIGDNITVYTLRVSASVTDKPDTWVDLYMLERKNLLFP